MLVSQSNFCKKKALKIAVFEPKKQYLIKKLNKLVFLTNYVNI